MRFIFVAVLAIVVLAFVPPAAGQALSPEQNEAIRQALGLPPGSTITLEHTTTKDGGTITVEEEATGEGAALRASGEKVVSDFNAGAPGANLTGKGQSTGGNTDTNNEVIGASSILKNPLFWIGFLALLLSVGTLFVRPPTFPVAIPIRTTAILAGAGAGLIASAMYPFLMLFVIGGVVLVLLLPYIQREFAAEKERKRAEEGELAKKALRSVAAGVSDFKKAAKDHTNSMIPPEMWDRLKDSLASHVEADEEDVIAKIRREDGLA